MTTMVVAAVVMMMMVMMMMIFAPEYASHDFGSVSYVYIQLTLSTALTFAPCSSKSLATDSSPYQQAR